MTRKVLGHVSQWFKVAVEFVLPSSCSVCRKAGAIFCGECLAKVVWLEKPVCHCCGRPTTGKYDYCFGCWRSPLPLGQVRAAVLYSEPLPTVIHKMKYKGLFALSEPLADLMVQAWPKWELPVDLALPVPLHAERLKERGYNQSELLVKHLCRQLGWESDPAGLLRIRHTPPQAQLANKEERIRNVKDAFVADESVVRGLKILLVDDVYTTGATMISAAEALLTAGASSVSGYCVARARHKSDRKF